MDDKTSWKDIFKEKTSDGIVKYSFTRVSSFILILFYIASASYTLFKTNTLPDIPTNVMMLILGAYGINKLRDRFTNKSGGSK